VYVALGVLAALTTIFAIALLAVVIKSLVFIGVQGVDIGAMYRDEFVPALILTGTFKVAMFYVILMAQGRDYGKTFSSAIAALSAVLILTLLITAATVAQDTSAQPIQPPTDLIDPFEDLRQDPGSRQLDELLR
jgi:hypothetical protein